MFKSGDKELSSLSVSEWIHKCDENSSKWNNNFKLFYEDTERKEKVIRFVALNLRSSDRNICHNTLIDVLQAWHLARICNVSLDLYLQTDDEEFFKRHMIPLLLPICNRLFVSTSSNCIDVSLSEDAVLHVWQPNPEYSSINIPSDLLNVTCDDRTQNLIGIWFHAWSHDYSPDCKLYQDLKDTYAYMKSRVMAFYELESSSQLGKTMLLIDRARGRGLLQREDIIEIAVSNGYDVMEVQFEAMTFPQQVQSVLSADCIVGVHGAGLINALLFNNNAPVIEIFIGREDYVKLARQVDVELVTINSQLYKGTSEELRDCDHSIDLEEFSNIFKQFQVG